MTLTQFQKLQLYSLSRRCWNRSWCSSNRLIGGKTDIIMMLNGALAGLVAITAEPLSPTPGLAIVIGSIGALIMYLEQKC